MMIKSRPTSPIGLHYFPDTLHYREQDLLTWLPELLALGARWLTLITPFERAIPEEFICSLIQADIEPVLHFPLPLDQKTTRLNLNVLLNTYARWGVKYVTLFDRPNLRGNWSAATWAQDSLVERFLDFYIPLAEAVQAAGMIPVFPPLEPGGDYWDTAFLQSAMRSLVRRGKLSLVQASAIGVYAWVHGRALDWGAGGPERWPAAQPYYTPADSQDQIGFRIFDWYQAIILAETGQSLPLMLLRCGSRMEITSTIQNQATTLRRHAETILSIAQIIADQVEKAAALPVLSTGKILREDKQIDDQVFSNILCANFWLLTAEQNSEFLADAWYRPDGSRLPVVNAFKGWTARRKQLNESENKNVSRQLADFDPAAISHPIDHYLLLPIYSWGVADWDLEAIRPFIQQYHPTVGFSVYEARLAHHVTIFGEAEKISQDSLTILRMAGCQIDRISQDGTLLAL